MLRAVRISIGSALITLMAKGRYIAAGNSTRLLVSTLPKSLLRFPVALGLGMSIHLQNRECLTGCLRIIDRVALDASCAQAAYNGEGIGDTPENDCGPVVMIVFHPAAPLRTTASNVGLPEAPKRLGVPGRIVHIDTRTCPRPNLASVVSPIAMMSWGSLAP